VSATPFHSLPVATHRQSTRWLASRVRTHPVLITVTLVAGILTAAATLVPVYALGWLVDATIDGRSSSTILTITAVLVVSALLTGTLTGVGNYVVGRLGETIVATLRESAVQRSLELPARIVEDAGRGDLLSRVGDDIARITRATAEVIPTVLNATLLIAVSVVSLFGIDYRLGLAGLLTLPMYVSALRWYLPRSGPLYAEERVAAGARTEALASSLHGIRTVHAYRLELSRIDDIRTESNRVKALSISVFRLLMRFVGRENLAEFCGMAVLFIAGFVLYTHDAVTIGEVTTAVLLFHRLFNPLGTVLFLFDELQSAGASLNRLVGITDLPITARPAKAVATDATLTVEDVRFAYTPGSDVLHGLSLTIPAGTRLALVGASGAGKTTAALIAAGMLDPDSGTVRIGSVPLTDIGTDALRSTVAVVSQEVHVTAGPLADDLRLAAPEAADDDLWHALDVVEATGWVRSLPSGIDTEIGDQAHQLTAAQQQQIALARLVLANPRIAVLDEATAEAGSAGAAALERAALAATAGRTTLVVAHRLTQAAAADVVAVMDAGRVVELGSHNQLIHAGGTYARLWDAWRGDRRSVRDEYQDQDA
jgi:ATP-binding cassette subfamily C protein